jgi:hypothetical protein
VPTVAPTRAPTAAPTTAAKPAAATMPDGWAEFRQAGFSGGVKKNWSVTFIDASDANVQQELESIVQAMNAPDTVKQGLAQQMAAEGSIFFVFMETFEQFTTNINIRGCEQLSDAAATGATMVNVLKQNNINASVVDKATYSGNTVDVYKMDILPGLETYQSLLKVGSCYTYATLSTKPVNSTAAIGDFKSFLSLLKIDSLRR